MNRFLLAIAIISTINFSFSLSGQQRVIRTGELGSSFKAMTMEEDKVEIPITLASTQILVDDVYVNGQGPFRFMLDTGGMGGGRVDSSLVDKLGLETSGEMTAGDGTSRGTRQMAMFELDSLEFLGVKFENVRVLSRDYNEHGAAVRGHIDGILGFALFKELLLTIDYANRKLVVEKGDLPAADGKNILSTNEQGIPGITVSILDEEYKARLDTGAMGWISISEEIAEKLQFVSEPEQIGEARTLTGKFPIKRAKLKGDAMIGQHKIQQPFIIIGKPLQGVNLGGFILRNFVVTYDQKNKRVKVLPAEKTRNANAPESSRLGMGPVEVSMAVANGRPTIEAKVNGQGPFKFLLDTGAGVTVFGPKLIEELKLESNGTTRIGDPTAPDQIEVKTYQVDTVNIGGASFGQVPIIAWKGLGNDDIRGIIGLPLFYDAIMQMDYPNNKLVLRRGALGPNDGSVPYRLDKGFAVTIDMKIGDETLPVHVDTGNMGFLNLPLSLSEKLELAEEPRKVGRARVASGEFDIYSAPMNGSLDFAGVTFENPQLNFNEKFPWGNIGSRALSPYKLTIDQVNQKLLLEKSGDSKSTKAGNPKPRYGIAFGAGGDGTWTVREVFAGSIAEKGGLKAGDIVLQVNGKKLSDIGPEERNKMFRSSPLKITVERSGEELEIELELK